MGGGVIEQIHDGESLSGVGLCRSYVRISRGRRGDSFETENMAYIYVSDGRTFFGDLLKGPLHGRDCGWVCLGSI